MRPLLGLAMIVKDEGLTLAATLASLEGIADVAIILDTGSTDDTREIVRACPWARLHEAPFVDYSTTRNLALALAEEQAVWSLMLSGGEVYHGDPRTLRAFLEALPPDVGAGSVRVRFGSLHFDSARLSRAGAGWRYRGATHEVMVDPADPSRRPPVLAPGWIDHRWTAADAEKKPARWRRDVELLAPAAAAGEPRAMFYLAQSYQCLGQTGAAIAWYERRLAAGGTPLETWEARFRRATLLTGDERRAALLECYEAAPTRAEPLHELAWCCHAAGDYSLATLYAAAAARMPPPAEGLFVDATVYAWRAHDILAMAAWHVGDLEQGLAAATAALAGYLASQPEEERPELLRLRAHVEWYKARAPSPLRSPARPSAARAAPRGWAVCIARTDLHGAAFHEIAQTLRAGLEELGHDATLVYGQPHSDRRTIVLGANFLPTDATLPAGSVIYNLEQAGSAWLADQRLLEHVRRHELWDYSAANVRMWASRGITAHLVPVGYAPCLQTIPPQIVEEDVDVLFVGSMNERRVRILAGLEAAGLRVKHLFGVYGVERDAWIARSKVCLNVHFYDAAIFEVARCSYLFANERAVVSEHSVDVGPFADAACFAAYARLVEMCMRLVRDDRCRAAVAHLGGTIMRSQPIAAILRRVVGSATPDVRVPAGAVAVLPPATVTVRDGGERVPIATIAGEWAGKVCAIAGRGASLAHLRREHFTDEGGIITFYGAAAVVRALGLRIPHLAMWKDSHSYTITGLDGALFNIGVETVHLTNPTLAPVASSCEEDPAGCEVIGHHEALPLGPTERLLLHLPESINQFAAHPAIVFDNEAMGLRWSMPSVCSAIYVARIMGAASLRMISFDAYATGSTEARGGGSDDTYRYQRAAIDHALAVCGYADAVEWLTPHAAGTRIALR